MASAEETDSFDIFNLELELREKLNELQWKSKSLDESQKELCEIRRNLYQTQSQLEDERRSSKQLEIQLKSALVTAKRFEEENIKLRTEEIRMRMKCDTSSIERNVLMEQARTARFENMDLKMKIQEYQRNLLKTKLINETLEASLMELKNSATRLHNKLNSNVRKLEHEQNQLKKSFEASIKFGQRVQTILNNCNIARKRDKEKFQELKKQLVVHDISHQQSIQLPVTSSCADGTIIPSLHKKMESTLKELRLKLESNLIEDKLALICAELEKMDGNFTKNSPHSTGRKITQQT